MPLNASVHIFFLDKLAACNLVDSNLDSLLEMLITGKQLRDRLLHEFVRSPSGPGGQLV
jgi:hypothetical protein